MGACVSSHHKSSTMKVQISSGSDRRPVNHVAISPSPIKEKLPIIDGNVPVKPQLPPLIQSTDESHDFGSKEETFFDSQAWLESDCESDFMSVNGEFTPSRGNTPMHSNLPAATPAVDAYKLSLIASQPFASPIKKNKRLSELFKESPRVNRVCDEEKGEPTNGNEVVGNLEAAPIYGGVSKPKREKWVQIAGVHGCLPRVLSSRRAVTHQQTVVRRK